jgi:hypothetical protein
MRHVKARGKRMAKKGFERTSIETRNPKKEDWDFLVKGAKENPKGGFGGPL